MLNKNGGVPYFTRQGSTTIKGQRTGGEATTRRKKRDQKKATALKKKYKLSSLTTALMTATMSNSRWKW